MAILKSILAVFTVLIFTLTILPTMDVGFIWPKYFFSDLMQLNWRAQFNADFLMHLLLLGTWAWWREGGGVRGWIIGFLCVVWGGMFTFPYFIYLIVRNQASMTNIFLGVQRKAQGAYTHG